jgi:TRAP-type C4-dicarboxylate transport system substrate-binding protein
MEQHGVKVTSLTPAEHDAFRKATAKVYDKWKKQIGADLVTKAEASIANRR